MPGIIVGIDGSDRSRQALEWAINEAAARHTGLTVLTVSEVLTGGLWSVPVYPGDLERTKQAQQAAQAETDSLLAKAGQESRPASVTVRAVTGVPAQELLRASASADMIVVGSRGSRGSRGSGGLKRLVTGSVSTAVTHHAHCPVVVIPADNP